MYSKQGLCGLGLPGTPFWRPASRQPAYPTFYGRKAGCGPNSRLCRQAGKTLIRWRQFDGVILGNSQTGTEEEAGPLVRACDLYLEGDRGVDRISRKGDFTHQHGNVDIKGQGFFIRIEIEYVKAYLALPANITGKISTRAHDYPDVRSVAWQRSGVCSILINLRCQPLSATMA